jgi:2-dehydro-3-deoxy-D-arabinonate dehydratase
MTSITATTGGLIIDRAGELRFVRRHRRLDALFRSRSPAATVAAWFDDARPGEIPASEAILAPIESQELWAAGVTYLRSKAARAAESREAGGEIFYDRVYEADRPELFFKATAHRVAPPGGTVRLRRDSAWNVPEPELVLAVNAHGSIFGVTVGNDVSSRSIEGENPLYLPQAKVYRGSASLGPRLVITDQLPPAGTGIHMLVLRDGATVFEGETQLAQMRRSLESLVEWLLREDQFPSGCYLMTGTGIVPGDDFTLRVGDEIRIRIDGIGTLVNHVGD